MFNPDCAIIQYLYFIYYIYYILIYISQRTARHTHAHIYPNTPLTLTRPSPTFTLTRPSPTCTLTRPPSPVVMVATKEQMQSANVEGKHRDYCAHTYINFMSCKKDNFPFVYKCKHELHTHEQCEFDELVSAVFVSVVVDIFSW